VIEQRLDPELERRSVTINQGGVERDNMKLEDISDKIVLDIEAMK
jgi:hypothetical protein